MSTMVENPFWALLMVFVLLAKVAICLAMVVACIFSVYGVFGDKLVSI